MRSEGIRRTGPHRQGYHATQPSVGKVSGLQKDSSTCLAAPVVLTSPGPRSVYTGLSLLAYDLSTDHLGGLLTFTLHFGQDRL